MGLGTAFTRRDAGLGDQVLATPEFLAQAFEFFLLAVAVALAHAIGAIWPRLRLHSAELLVIYAMSTVTVAIGGNGGGGNGELVPS